MATPKKKVEPTIKYSCRTCGRERPDSKFYVSESNLDINGKMSICKDCCADIYENNEIRYNNLEKALYHTCRVLDLRYSNKVVVALRTHMAKAEKDGRGLKSIFGVYKSKLSTTFKKNNPDESLDFLDSDHIDGVNLTAIEVGDEDIEVEDEILKFFGRGYTDEQYMFLWEDYRRLVTSYDSDTYALQLLFKDIAYLNLQIEEAKRSGQAIDKLITTRQKLLTDANIKPSQEQAMNSSETNTMGVLIHKMENTRPASEPDPEWENAQIVKLSQMYSGQIARMENIQGELLNNYEKFIDEFTVSMDGDD